MVIVAPVEIVLKEISLVIVGPGESSIDSSQWQTEVRDGPWVSFLHVVVFEDPVSVSCGKERNTEQSHICFTAETSIPRRRADVSLSVAVTILRTELLASKDGDGKAAAWWGTSVFEQLCFCVSGSPWSVVLLPS